MNGSAGSLRGRTPKAPSPLPPSQWMPVEQKPATPDGTAASPAPSPTTSRLLTIDKIPAWYAENPFIHSGYRPVSHSAKACLGSWRYAHNQTANIATHLAPALLSAALQVLLARHFSASYPSAAPADRAVVHVHLAACSLCFGASAAYHTLLCHSHEVADLWVRLDYVGISVLILGSFVPGLYFGFYCEPGLLRLYLVMITSMGFLNIYLSMNDRYGAKDWIMSRLLPFLGMGLSAFVPILHAAVIFPYDQLQKQAGLNYYYAEGAFMIVGVVFLATKFPERWYPGKFDYWGSSHQIFHCFVVFGAVSHLAGILSAFDWNYEHQRCDLI